MQTQNEAAEQQRQEEDLKNNQKGKLDSPQRS